MTQVIRPVSLLSNTGGWYTHAGSAVGADLVAAIGETSRDDGTFAQGLGISEYALGTPSGVPGPGTCRLDVGFYRPSDVADRIDLNVRIRQGTRVLAERILVDVGTGLITVPMEFDSALVTDWSDLRLRLETTLPSTEPTHFDLHIYPGDDARALVNAAGEGWQIRWHPNDDGSPYTYEITPPSGAHGFRPANGVQNWGSPVTRGEFGEVSAPVKIRHTGDRSLWNVADRLGVEWHRLEMDGSGQTGLFPDGRIISGGGVCDNLLVSHCRLHSSNTQGLGGWGGILEYCELDNHSRASAQQGVLAAAKSVKIGTIERYNYVHDCFGNGLWHDCQSAQNTIIGNRVVRIRANGIFYEISPGPAYIGQNYIGYCNYPNAAGRGGMIIASSTSVTVEGNTFEANLKQTAKAYNERRAGNLGAEDCGTTARGYCVNDIHFIDNRIISGPAFLLDPAPPTTLGTVCDGSGTLTETGTTYG